MRIQLKQYTEPIFATLDGYRDQLVEHPLLTAAKAGELPTRTLHEFAFHQYSDSILWIPMLAQMKERAQRSRRLRRAIEDNIRHEAGICSTSHVTLAAQLMRSLGIRRLDDMPTATFASSASLWLSDAFCAMTEPETAGWLLVAETLVPIMFAAVLPAYEAAGADITYFSEHVHVDTDEHATWMAESVEDVLEIYGPECATEVMAGMADAWNETREVPDALWNEAQCASR